MPRSLEEPGITALELGCGAGLFSSGIGILRKHLLRDVIDQQRVGDVVHRAKMLPQPPVLLRISIDPDQGVNRHDNSTCLRFARIYNDPRMTADIFYQVPIVSAPIQVRICKMSIGQPSVRGKLIEIGYEMRII